MSTSPTPQYTDFSKDVLGRYVCNGLDEAMRSTAGHRMLGLSISSSSEVAPSAEPWHSTSSTAISFGVIASWFSKPARSCSPNTPKICRISGS